MKKPKKPFFTVAEGLDDLSDLYRQGKMSPEKVKKYLLWLAAVRGRIELSAFVGVPPAQWAKLVGAEDAAASAANILFEKENYEKQHAGTIPTQGQDAQAGPLSEDGAGGGKLL